MKKGETIQIDIIEQDYPKKGIGYYDGIKVVVPNALLGQKIEAKILKMRKNKFEGKIVKVVEKAPYEIESECTHFSKCGGCRFQNVPYEIQLQEKRQYLEEILSTATNHSVVLENMLPSPDIYEYRNKMEFSFGDEYKEGPLALGLHERGRFYEIVTTTSCLLVDQDFRELLNTTLNFFQVAETPFYHKKTHQGLLRHLVVRKGMYTGDILVNLVTTSQESFQKEKWVDLIVSLKLKGKIKGVLHTVNNSMGDVVQADHLNVLYGQPDIQEKLLGMTFYISPFSFFQTNTKGAEILYSVVQQLAGEKKERIIFDLYSGTGTIGQLMAPVAKQVIGIEIVEEAVIKANENAQMNGLDNCKFIAGDVLQEVESIGIQPDIIILDPPRSGIHPKAIQKILSYKPDMFVYVSCNPKSLLKDLPIMIEEGYRLERAIGVDLFPMTPHVETVCLLTRK